MVKNIVTIGVAILSIFLSYVAIKYPCVSGKSFDSLKLKPDNRTQFFYLLGIAISIGTATTLMLFLYHSSWLFVIKRIVLLACLWCLAYIDLRKHIIPNRYLLVLLIFRGVWFIFEFIFSRESFRKEFLSCLIACFGAGLIFVLMRLIVKNGIGFGDVKLFSVIGLYVGIESIITIIFLSFVVSFFVSLILLASKRKNKKDQLAFAPFILAGYFISAIFFGM